MKIFWKTLWIRMRLAVWGTLLMVMLSAEGRKGNKTKPSQSRTKELEFISPMKNQSVAIGKDAEFTCKLRIANKNLLFQLVWIKLDTQTILAIEKQLVQSNPRITVSQQPDRLEFTLRIRNTQAEDAGVYACRINTKPFSQMRAHLDVQVPPHIVAADTTEHVMVQEGADVLLKCKATGHPSPTIVWSREDRGLIRPKGHPKAYQHKGSSLHLARISKIDMATYICLAENGIPPAVSQRIIVKTEFHPIVYTEPKYVAAWQGGTGELKCEVEAYPPATLVWYRDGNAMPLISNSKYEIRQEQVPKSMYRVNFSLIIKSVDAKDFGDYLCSATNYLGPGEGSVKLHEINEPKRGNVLRDHSAYDGHQMDQGAWASESALASRRKAAGSAGSSSRTGSAVVVLLIGLLCWRLDM